MEFVEDFVEWELGLRGRPTLGAWLNLSKLGRGSVGIGVDEDTGGVLGAF